MNPDLFDPTGATDRKYSMSYGMSLYPVGPYIQLPNYKNFSPLADIAFSAPGGTTTLFPSTYYPTLNGQWYKLEQWGVHSQDRGIVADSNGLDIICSKLWTKADEAAGAATPAFTEPASMGIDYAPTAGAAYTGTLANTLISIDALRHVSPSASRQKIFSTPGCNMLFVDGHAQGVTPRQAWIAVYGGGVDMTQ